uniref:Protein-lysine N-methyltransferase EOG090X0ABW n=1 Tax=Alona affinis TaxID=381656 RepID=A0A9N6WQX2_9CRUS|nr:EOG090X0ABW [Alona affinis]
MSSEIVNNESLPADDEDLELSESSLAALNEFLAERKEREEKLRQIAEAAETSQQQNLLDEVDLDEDWQLSQFWYDDLTSQVLADEVLRLVGETGSVACLSCPTLYKHLRKVKHSGVTVRLLEFDTRFSMYGTDFVFYDYRSPLEFPSKEAMSSSFDVVVADPPFLSEECLTKTALTMRYLSKGPLILCTGAVMEQLADRLLHLKMCSFRPSHRNNLANDFRCYANYDFDAHVVQQSAPVTI